MRRRPSPRIVVPLVLVACIACLCASAVAQETHAFSTQASFSSFNNWTLGRLFNGKERLSPEQLAHVQFWVALVKEPLEALVGFVPRLFVAVVFLGLFWAIHRALRKLVIGGMSRAGVDASIREMLGHLIRWGVIGFGVVIAFNQIGIQITALLTGLSIMGLALGLAAQDTLANFIAAIVIIWDEPFRVGQTVTIDGVVGSVSRVTFRSTRVLTFDGEVIVFPNSFMLGHRVSNQTVNPVKRVAITLEISALESIKRARHAILSTLKGDERISDSPPPAVLPTECADGVVKLLLQFWVHDEATKAATQPEYLEKAKEALDAAGISVAPAWVRTVREARAAA